MIAFVHKVIKMGKKMFGILFWKKIYIQKEKNFNFLRLLGGDENTKLRVCLFLFT